LKVPVALGLAAVYLFLAALHVFWAAGGTWGGVSAIPEVAGRKAFTPGPGITLAVAGALVLAACVVLGVSGLAFGFVPAKLFRFAAFVLGGVFLLRAVGDFRLVGFFKSVRGTAFATNDTLIYSPLCLVLAAGVFWLATRSVSDIR
jgi:hypothetical protein